MLLMVVGNYASEPDSETSIYGVYDDPVLAVARMRELTKRTGGSFTEQERNGWPSYSNDVTMEYYLEEIEVNKDLEIY